MTPFAAVHLVAVKLYPVPVGITEVDIPIAPLSLDLHPILLGYGYGVTHEKLVNGRGRELQQIGISSIFTLSRDSTANSHITGYSRIAIRQAWPSVL